MEELNYEQVMVNLLYAIFQIGTAKGDEEDANARGPLFRFDKERKSVKPHTPNPVRTIQVEGNSFHGFVVELCFE
jgi:hypothetical protein